MAEAGKRTGGRAAAPGTWSGALVTVGIVIVMMLAVGYLPPDTSLSEVRKAGVLRICTPDDFPPLVNAGGEKPGIDVEIVSEIARRLDLRTAFNRSSAMGKDINPRNWRLNRAQCQVIAGGVIASDTTRSYLDTTPAHLEVGWAVVSSKPIEKLEGATVGFSAGLSGFDRIALGRFLRSAGAKVAVVPDARVLARGLSEGTYDLAVTESMSAREMAEENGWTVQWLSDAFAPSPLALGLWKGDLTLKRAIDEALDAMRRDGTLDAIIESYELKPIDSTFDHTAPSDPA